MPEGERLTAPPKPKIKPPKEEKSIDTMVDEALNWLNRANLFPSNQRNILTNKVAELNKSGNVAALKALLESIERQAKTLIKKTNKGE